jgi:hypothetical protein
MNVAAFQFLNTFEYPGHDLGSQAKFVRDSTGAWYVLAYRGAGFQWPEDPSHAADYIDVHCVAFAAQYEEHGLSPQFRLLGPLKSNLHIVLPAGDTSFNNTGTHYVDGSGRLLVYSSYRWAENEGDPYGFESRVDECAADQ